MGVAVQQQPLALTPAYSDNVLVAQSTNVITGYKMKYVFDIFTREMVSGTTTYVGRVKQTPNPSGVGMLDLSRYLQLSVNQDIFGGLPFDIPQTSKLQIGENTARQYWVQCGEEFAPSVTAPVVLYNGNGSVSTGTTLTSTSSISGVTFNGVKQFSEGYNWNATPYVAVTGRTFLTNSPRTLYKENDEYVTVACLFGTYNSTAFSIGGSLFARVYDANNNLIKTFNPQSGYTATSSAIQPIFGGARLADITFVTGATWNKVELQIGSSNQTEVITIMRKTCPWQKYNPVDILFLNRLGGWDNFRFYGSRNEATKISRGTYQNAYGTWSSTLYDYETYERGKSNIRTDLIVEGELMSDFLDRDTVNWLEELATSPQVYIIDTNAQLRPISITSTNFKKQIKGNVKLRQVAFTYEYSAQQRTQQQ